MSERIGGYVPERFIDMEKLKKAMEENLAVRDAHEAGFRGGRKKGWEEKPLRERRERIATAALQGLLANGKSPFGTWDHDRYAEGALDYADALIAALDTQPEKAKEDNVSGKLVEGK